MPRIFFPALRLVLPVLSWLLPFAAQADSTFPVALANRDRLVLEQLVCGEQFGVGVADVDARAFSAQAKVANFADVKCRPHAKLNDQPLYYVAQCVRGGGQWACSPAELETRVPLKDRSVLVRPGTVAPQLAFQTIQKISTYGYFQANAIDAALQSTCNMGMGKTADLVEISCRDWSISVSFWCPQQKTTPVCPRVIYMAKHD